MNAAVRSIVRSAEAMGIKVKGVMRGYNGLIENHFVDLDIRSVSDIFEALNMPKTFDEETYLLANMISS